jgi:hypothetical protein
MEDYYMIVCRNLNIMDFYLLSMLLIIMLVLMHVRNSLMHFGNLLCRSRGQLYRIDNQPQ